MILEIDDNLTGEERRKKLRLEPLLYALEKFDGSKEKASLWLGMSARWIRRLVKEYPELKKYNVRNVRDIETKAKIRRAMRRNEDIKSFTWHRYADERERKYLDRIYKEVLEEEKLN